MRHDVKLTDFLAEMTSAPLERRVFRATRQNLDPLLFSSSGGRWSPPGEVAVLYTALEREGALAEIVFHWSQIVPLPRKPVAVHELIVSADRVVTLDAAALAALGVVPALAANTLYARTQEIGAAAAFMGFDALVVPSVRYAGQNVVLIEENHKGLREVASTETVDWVAWASDRGLLPPTD